MIVSLLAVLSAALVEHFRLEEWENGYYHYLISAILNFNCFIYYFRNRIIQVISNTSYNASALPILWQIPQVFSDLIH